MQRFNAPLTEEDQKTSRQIAGIMLIGYSAVALMLTASVAARVALKTPAIGNASIEVATKPETAIFRRE
jgi:hypothetical protein